MSKLQQEIYRSLSGDEVLKLCKNKSKVILYEDLKNYKNIDQLLAPYGSVIILYEYMRNDNESYGHYTCLNRLKSGEIEHFDSLLMKPDEELKMIPPEIKEETRQNRAYLARMLYESGYPVSYNHYKLQNDDTSTCGRWAGLRCRLKGLTLDEFAKLWMGRKYSPDTLITYLTM